MVQIYTWCRLLEMPNERSSCCRVVVKIIEYPEISLFSSILLNENSLRSRCFVCLNFTDFPYQQGLDYNDFKLNN